MTRAVVVAAALALALARDSRAEPLPRATVADRLVVHKADRTLTLYWHGAKLKSYRIALGAHPVGAKQQRGDERTPEGLYTATKRTTRTWRR